MDCLEHLDKSALSDVDAKGFVPDDARNAFFRKLRVKSENRSCFECTSRNPTWISLTYGVYLCLECSGEHRRKGVHISFVRSVELDRFTPEQMVQMAVGGNGRAWEHFKQSGMGKLGDVGRPVDYNSKVAQRYKQIIEGDAAKACERLGVNSKARAKEVAAAADTTLGDDSKAPATSKAAASDRVSSENGGYPAAPKCAGPPAASKAKAAPTPVSVPSVIRQPASGASIFVSSGNTAASAVPKPSGFALKQKAKELDFDFDFDEVEREANQPAPKAAAVPPTRADVAPKKTNNGGTTFSNNHTHATSKAADISATRFSNAKGISSSDFFHEATDESAQARMERENRYHKIGNAGAISSDAFFGDGDEQNSRRVTSSDSIPHLKATVARGAEILTSYLNKATI